MSYSFDHHPDTETIQAVKQNLRQLAIQLEQPDDSAASTYSCSEAIDQLYEAAEGLVGHLAPDSLTIARVAGVLLVYQLPDTDPNEVRWFKSQLQNCPDTESIEELIDSLSRPDAL